jgi:hypothetical protein
MDHVAAAVTDLDLVVEHHAADAIVMQTCHHFK